MRDENEVYLLYAFQNSFIQFLDECLFSSLRESISLLLNSLADFLSCPTEKWDAVPLRPFDRRVFMKCVEDAVQSKPLIFLPFATQANAQLKYPEENGTNCLPV